MVIVAIPMALPLFSFVAFLGLGLTTFLQDLQVPNGIVVCLVVLMLVERRFESRLLSIFSFFYRVSA